MTRRRSMQDSMEKQMRADLDSGLAARSSPGRGLKQSAILTAGG